MKGAREYAKLFGESCQFGKLYLEVGEHARGMTFKIYILPTEEKLQGSIYCIKDAVEVYGIVSGHPGWTETYGWLHEGKWIEDFEDIVEQKKVELLLKQQKLQAAKEEKDKQIKEKIATLLENY